MLKRLNKLFIFLLILILLVSCSENQPSDSMAEKIIRDFWQGQYEYTKTSYLGKNPKIITEEMEGKLISDPYQQYERAVNVSETEGISEQYWYIQDGKVVHNVKMSVGDTPDQCLSHESDVKGSALYIKDDLSFNLDRKESISGRDVYIYRAQYEDELHIDYSYLPEKEVNDITEISVPYTTEVEYYIDFSKKEVLRIRIDGTGSARAGAIANLMYSGMSQEEAEKKIQEKETVEPYEVIIEIKAYNEKIKIEVPQYKTN